MCVFEQSSVSRVETEEKGNWVAPNVARELNEHRNQGFCSGNRISRARENNLRSPVSRRGRVPALKHNASALLSRGKRGFHGFLFVPRRKVQRVSMTEQARIIELGHLYIGAPL